MFHGNTRHPLAKIALFLYDIIEKLCRGDVMGMTAKQKINLGILAHV